MFFSRCILLLTLALTAFSGGATFGTEVPDLQTITRIREEAYNNSRVMKTARYLCNTIGPRLTGSPNLKIACDWSQDQLRGWGLANVHLESWGPFGRGWSLQYVSVRMLSPDQATLVAIPKAWTSSTPGLIKGRAVQVKIDSEGDFATYRGRLSGMIVFNGNPRDLKPHEEPDLARLSLQQKEELERFQLIECLADSRKDFLKEQRLREALNAFLTQERALALVEPSLNDRAIYMGRGGGYQPETPPSVPSLVMTIEHYNRIARLVGDGGQVELEIEIRSTFHNQESLSHNVIAEIPGTDRIEEIVMLGAHLDSWHAGTGATDNAAGVAVVMEAVRILKAIGVKPRRTIRMALWSGEEQGAMGSSAYVSQHFGSRAEPTDPEERGFPPLLRKEEGPLRLKPEHQRLSVYFNMDNGTGKILGIFLQNNAAARPIFEAWLNPLRDLGATILTMRNACSTDHLPFDAVGLPGFQFIQDPVEHFTWHSSLDVYDHLQAEDLKQASVVMASFVYNAAMLDEMIPRKPLPFICETEKLDFHLSQ